MKIYLSPWIQYNYIYSRNVLNDNPTLYIVSIHIAIQDDLCVGYINAPPPLYSLISHFQSFSLENIKNKIDSFLRKEIKDVVLFNDTNNIHYQRLLLLK